MLDLKKFIVLPVLFFCVFGNEDISQTNQTFETYLAEIMKCKADVKIVLSDTDYYDDGTIKEADVLGFASKEKDVPHEFKLNLIDKDVLKKLVAKGKEAGVEVSLAHIDIEEKELDNYDTEEGGDIDTAAERVVFNEHGFDTGLSEEILDTIYQSNTECTINFAEYGKNGNLKRNTTTTFDPRRVVLVKSENVSTKFVEEAMKLLKRSFKIDTNDRAGIVVELFRQKFKKMRWQVLVNPNSYKVKSDKMITLSYEGNTFVIIGNQK